MAYIEAERFAELKARVKAECLRRCHTGSVAEYGGEKYEYTNSPTEDHTVRCRRSTARKCRASTAAESCLTRTSPSLKRR
jgi:hypothetical protein